MGTSSKPAKGYRGSMASLFQVLGNDTRMRILRDLSTGEKCVCTIFKRLKLPQNLVSHHLGILREKGVIRSRRAGKWVYYSLNEKLLARFADDFRDILGTPKAVTAC